MEHALNAPAASSRAGLPSAGAQARAMPCSLADFPARSGAGSLSRYRVTFEVMGGSQEGDRTFFVEASRDLEADAFAGSRAEETS